MHLIRKILYNLLFSNLIFTTTICSQTYISSNPADDFDVKSLSSENSKVANIKKFANPILYNLENLGFNYQGPEKSIKQDQGNTHVGELGMLRKMPKGTPAVLLEIGYMSNPAEVDYLRKNPEKVATAIYKGLMAGNTYFSPKK